MVSLGVIPCFPSCTNKKSLQVLFVCHQDLLLVEVQRSRVVRISPMSFPAKTSMPLSILDRVESSAGAFPPKDICIESSRHRKSALSRQITTSSWRCIESSPQSPRVSQGISAWHFLPASRHISQQCLLKKVHVYLCMCITKQQANTKHTTPRGSLFRHRRRWRWRKQQTNSFEVTQAVE